MYTLEFERRVRKELKALPSDVVRRVWEAFDRLRDDPFAGTYKKLVGANSYRVRVGDYRVIYDVNTVERKVTVLKVGHRRDIYHR